MTSKILVVDDQLGVRRLLFEAFKEEGYTVSMAASGYEAIDKVKTDRPDLILMDMKMPGMNGLEALKEIKQLDQTILVIMMTAYGELDIIAQAKKLGVKEHITKPFDLNDLKQTVRQTLLNEKVS